MNQKKIHNVRDLAIGFFGWFLVGNLVTAIILFLFYSAFLGVLAIFTLLTFSLIYYFFTQNRNWIGFGIISAIIINGALMASLNLLMWFTPFIPLPVGLFLLMS